MATLAELLVKVGIDSRGVERGFSKTKAAIGLGIAGLAVFTAKLGVDFVKAAEESRKVTNQTMAVIKSTGGAAGVAARDVQALSMQLSNKAGIDDELIQSGANVLLTFTKVRNEVGKGNDIFNQGTAAALDMSVALGQDMQSSVIQVGKALNDPIKGMTALRRVGVSFTAQQIEQVKAMVAAGDTLGAQKLILRELTTEFGGSAAAQASATDKLKVVFGNMGEAIGGVLLPYVDQFANWMAKTGVPLIEQKMVPAVSQLAYWIANKAAPAIRDDWLPALVKIGKTIGTVVLPILDRMGDRFLDSSVQGQLAFISLTAAAKVAAPAVAKAIGLQVAKWAWLGVQALAGAAKVAAAWLISLGPIGLVIAAVAAAATLIILNWDKIKRFVIAAAKATVDFLKRNWPLIVGIILGPLALTVVLVQRHWDTIKRAFRAGIDFILSIWRTGWRNVWSALQTGWQPIGDFFVKLPGRIKGFLTGSVTWLVEGGKNILRGLRSGFTQYWGTIVKWFKDVPGKILRAIGISSPPQWAVEAGRWILKGITKGLGLGVGSAMEFLGKLAGKFTGALRTAWDTVSGVVPILRGGGNKTNRAMGQTMARDLYGWVGAQWEALNNLVMSESGWSNTAQNPTSTAYGIGQFLNSTWAGVGFRKTSDPATQIRAMLKYIVQRYGDPIKAWAFKRAHNWYEGGAWRTQDEWARLHRGEMVLPRGIAEVVRSQVGGDRGAPVQNFYVSTTYDARRIARDVGDEVAWQWKVAG